MPRRRALLLLGTLYFAQGLPFGFQATALPVYLRASGVSLTTVSLSGALALPWMLKALWAPLVDRWGSARFGRRKSWLVPLQALLCVTCAAAALVRPEAELTTLLALVFLMNLLAATQDIAADGLAVDLLRDADLGPGNAGQVVGYKLGMLSGGGLLVWASGSIGFRGLFVAMAALMAAVLAVVLAHRELPALAAAGEPSARERPSFGEVASRVCAAARAPRAAWLFAVVATYKLGESMVDGMFKPFLVDSGFTPARIGLWVGTWGTVASLLGSFAGGLLAARLPFVRAVAIAAALRVAPLGAEWLLALGRPDASAVVAVTCAEHFFGGLLTTTMFALMMSRVDRRIGATHYTLFATLEVAGKSPGAWLAGPLAERLGYPPVFLVGTILSVAFLPLLLPLLRAEAASDARDLSAPRQRPAF